MTATDEIMGILQATGHSAYFGEPVSVVEHALQTAHFAREAGAAVPLVIAALLHDIGHLLVGAPQDIAAWEDDARHETAGSNWLLSRFGAAVSHPVRLHVAAKRYLCSTSESYRTALSTASQFTLALQGGLMSLTETEAFRAEPHFRDAVRLRIWDDRAKVRGLEVPGLAEYVQLMDSLLLPGT